ncbi:hypothetical protein ACSMFR_03820 [Listeria aquatica]|uniref:hypothetical protein n=1 Tax=Listeria aquatica TaxID=1494960 RepID=UPI003F6F9522
MSKKLDSKLSISLICIAILLIIIVHLILKTTMTTIFLSVGLGLQTLFIIAQCESLLEQRGQKKTRVGKVLQYVLIFLFICTLLASYLLY